jgi:hypothetical protein
MQAPPKNDRITSYQFFMACDKKLKDILFKIEMSLRKGDINQVKDLLHRLADKENR